MVLRAFLLILSLLSNGLLPMPAFAAPTTAAEAAGDRAQIDARGRRTALVIGNGAYKVSPLPNPVNDARLVAASLAAARFKVIKLENATQEQMLKGITEFGDEIENGGVGLFYFAGHGVQLRGENFLIPVDAKIDREEEIRTRAVNAQEVLDRMATAGNSLNLVFLDACRNDPFPRRTRAASQGLAKMDAALGTLISFATAPGAVAEDGSGRNSPYSRHLAESLRIPGLRVEDVLKRVRTRVREDTKGRQVTWDNSSIEGDFYFLPSADAATPAAPTGAAGAEIALWNSVQDSNDPRELEIYLRRYPNGKFAAIAKQRIDSARASDSARPAPPARPAAPQEQTALVRPQAAKAPDAVAALLPKAGDTWTYSFRSIWGNVGERTLVYRVTAVSEGEVRETMSVQGAAISTDERAFGSSVAVVERHVAGVAVHELNPYLQAFAHLEPGMRWQPVTVPETAGLATPWSAHARVVGREKVRTPAGEFDALRIQLDANRPVISGALAITVEPARIDQVLWYAPQAKRIVRQERKVFTTKGNVLDRDTVELLKYEIH